MNQKFIELWGDVVSQKDLVKSIFLTSFLTLGAYFLAPANETSRLFFGLAGAVVGFFLATLWIKPKRIIMIEKERQK